MTKEELMALLRDPDQTGQSVNELNRLIDENPYFHTGHQLHLQALKKTDEEQMALQLSKTALNVRDRGLLYNYINRPSAFRQQTTPQDDVDDVLTPYAPGSAYVSPEVDIHQIQQSQTSEIDIPEPRSLGMEGMRKDTAEHVLAEEKIMSDADLMAIIQRQLEHISVVSDKATTDNVDPKETSNIEAATNESVDIRPIYSEEQLATDLAKIMPKQTDVVEVRAQEIVTAEKSNVEIDIADQNKEVTVNDLIDSFLKANPKIIPSDTEYVVDLANSLQEDQDIATETLADIYTSQGHFQKAIEIYEHLILKYPEKHIYFAAQIERLKQENNNL